MNIREYLQREAEGVCMREYVVNWDFDFDAIREDEERRRQGERRRRTDREDGFFAPLEDGEE